MTGVGLSGPVRELSSSQLIIVGIKVGVGIKR